MICMSSVGHLFFIKSQNKLHDRFYSKLTLILGVLHANYGGKILPGYGVDSVLSEYEINY